MDVSANSLRDTIIQALAIGYDWDSETHVANLGVRSNDGVLLTFQITGVSQIDVSEDFTSKYVAFCSLIRSPERIYLSLDPYEEGIESERDNFSFVGRDITQVEYPRMPRTIGSSDRGSRLRLTKEGVDDWDKVPSFDAGETPRPSTSSFGLSGLIP